LGTSTRQDRIMLEKARASPKRAAMRLSM
jgi:hypothetical protein